MATPLTAEQIKQAWQEKGITCSGWARKHGFKPPQVVAVLNGHVLGLYGRSHNIAVLLGMKIGTVTDTDTDT